MALLVLVNPLAAVATFLRLAATAPPDEESAPAASVLVLHDAITTTDAIIIISSPEYAQGVTGTIKNTLDWLVGHVPFAGKPVALLNPSRRAEHADTNATLRPAPCRVHRRQTAARNDLRARRSLQQ